MNNQLTIENFGVNHVNLTSKKEKSRKRSRPTELINNYALRSFTKKQLFVT